jgi:hypothetical protein
VLLNHRLLIGAAGSNTFLKKTINGSNFLSYHTYGLYTEYHINPKSPLHLIAGIMAGAGYLQQKQTATSTGDSTHVGEWHAVIVPNVGLSIDVTSFMRIHTRALYNYSADPQTKVLTKENLQSVAGSVSLVFGKF